MGVGCGLAAVGVGCGRAAWGCGAPNEMNPPLKLVTGVGEAGRACVGC